MWHVSGYMKLIISEFGLNKLFKVDFLILQTKTNENTRIDQLIYLNR